MATATQSKSTSSSSAKLKDARGLLVHEMADIRSAEGIILDMLEKAAGAATSSELKKGLEAHRAQTQGHLENVDAAFEALGEKPEEVECKGAKGLSEELDHAIEEKPAAEVLDTMIAGGAAKTEQYEITAYTGMVELANKLGEKKVAELLSKNLKQEEETLKKVEKIEQTLSDKLPMPSKN